MTSMITARVDSKKRKSAEKVFDAVGLTTSAAVNLFICAVAMHGGIPFPIGVAGSSSALDADGHDGRRKYDLSAFAGKVKYPVKDGVAFQRRLRNEW